MSSTATALVNRYESPIDEVSYEMSSSTAQPYWERSLGSRVSLLVNSTSLNTADSYDEIIARLRSAFETGRDELFEVGMESNLSKTLTGLLSEYGDYAIEALLPLIRSQQVHEETVVEALRTVARVDYVHSRARRLWILEYSLYSDSYRIRDAAVSGLGCLDDPHAIQYLERALEREPQPELRSDILQVIEQLKETSQCH